MKKMLITGGASGIGFSLAKYYAKKSFDVTVLDKTIGGIEEFNSLHTSTQIEFQELDCTSWNDISRFCEDQNESNRDFQVLINNVSPRHKITLNEESEESWTDTVNGTLFPAFLLSRLMVDKVHSLDSARIINISSVVSVLAASQSFAYHAAKSGLESLTRKFANEAGDCHPNFTVNSIRLGFVVQERHLPMYNAAENTEYREKVSNYLPNHVLPGREIEIAQTIDFLIDERSRFINGAQITLDGGASVQEQFTLLLNRK